LRETAATTLTIWRHGDSDDDPSAPF
jgi:hypothetical protein